MLLYPLPPPIFELGFAASRHLFPAPSSTVLLNSAPALQAADWLALHPSVHAALDIASRAAALTQFLAAGHSMPLSNATIDRAGPPLKLPALPTALPGGSTIAHLLSKAFIAVPRAEWIVTTVPSKRWFHCWLFQQVTAQSFSACNATAPPVSKHPAHRALHLPPPHTAGFAFGALVVHLVLRLA